MSIVRVPFSLTGGGAAGYVIEGSGLFDGSSDYLSWTPSGAADSDTIWTASAWVKRAGLGSLQRVFVAGDVATGNNFDAIYFDANDKLNWQLYRSGLLQGQYTTTAVFRDTSAWMHVHVTRSGATVTISVNGEAITAFDTSTAPDAGDQSMFMQSGEPTTISYQPWGGTNRYNGYIAEAIMLDGTASAVSNFGKTDTNGNWVPIDPSGLTFGTNGFWLDFADSADLGNDVSGNGNDFTPTSMSSANATNDNPADDAANGYGNFMLWNPLEPGTKPTFSNGNTTESHSASDVPAFGNWVFSDGLWQIELTADVFTAGDWIGVCNEDFAQGTDIAVSSDTWVYKPSTGYKSNGTGDPGTAYGSGASATDRINIALDMDQGDGSNKIWIGVNGTWENSGDPAAGTGAMYSNLPARVKLVQGSRSSSAGTFTINLSLTDALETGFKQPVTYSLPAPTPAASATPITGSFTGNANADGPVVWLGYTPDTSETSTINSNTITWGTHALPTAGGMKIITSSASYNTAGSNTYSIAVEHPFGGEGISQARAR